MLPVVHRKNVKRQGCRPDHYYQFYICAPCVFATDTAHRPGRLSQLNCILVLRIRADTDRKVGDPDYRLIMCIFCDSGCNFATTPGFKLAAVSREADLDFMSGTDNLDLITQLKRRQQREKQELTDKYSRNSG